MHELESIMNKISLGIIRHDYLIGLINNYVDDIIREMQEIICVGPRADLKK